MTMYTDLLKRLRAGRSRFYPADFHTHSPASFDVRRGERFEQMPAEMQSALRAIPEALSNNLPAYEQAVMHSIPPSDFVQALARQRDALRLEGNIDPDSDWGIIAITDHNVCGYACAAAEYASANAGTHRLLVLPGIELDIQYDCEPTQQSPRIHVLCIFDVGTKESDIRLVLSRYAKHNNWDIGAHCNVGALHSFVDALRHDTDYPALCIAAHVSSSKGLRRENSKALLTHVEAEITRIEGELASNKDVDRAALKKQLAELLQGRAPDAIALETLRLIGRCGFDALQVSSSDEAVHYRRLHRFLPDKGRASPILASDAHTPTNVFKAGTRVPHLKLPALNSIDLRSHAFASIKQSLRLGETRFSATPGQTPQAWIAGLSVAPDSADAENFWPFASPDRANTSSFELPLSRNLNTFVGGRGSGKTAAIEAIAFVTKPSHYNYTEREFNRGDVGEHIKRACATLAGCTVTVVWQGTADEYNDLPKRAVVCSRYFDKSGGHSPVKYYDIYGQELVPAQLPSCQLQVFRLSEIEKQAEPARLRPLFDSACGDEIDGIQQSLDAELGRLKAQRKSMRDVASKINALVEDESPLRSYALRRQLFAQTNTQQVSEACKAVDLARAAEEFARGVSERWDDALSEEDIERLRSRIASFFDDTPQTIDDNRDEANPHLDELKAILEGPAENQPAAIRVKLEQAVQDLEVHRVDLERKLGAAVEEIDNKRKLAESELSEAGLPKGSQDRDAKKRAFEDSKKALSDYREALGEWEQGVEARATSRRKINELLQRRSALRTQVAGQIQHRLEAELDSDVIQIVIEPNAGQETAGLHAWLVERFKERLELKNHEARAGSLVAEGLTPDALMKLLLDPAQNDWAQLVRDRTSAAAGKLGADDAQKVLAGFKISSRLDAESAPEIEATSSPEDDLPTEVRDGLLRFESLDHVEAVLELDEIVFDDVPTVLLNDRPTDPESELRPLDELSPGQRCSAVLPIVLLTGDGPLIIDQPEDNLDNRLIRQVIVNILAGIKLRRQVIVATHNPNLPVLGDVESACVLQGVGKDRCKVIASGDLDSKDVAGQLTEVMEGGREAFQYRQTIYATHWDGPVEA